MKTLNIMIKPASSLCNMKCGYCFYADVSDKREIKSCGLISDETRSAILHQVEFETDSGDCVQFTFQGGEPTLVGLPFFESFVNEVKKWEKNINVSYALQTNGILIDEEWCKFLKENQFLVGVSFDILPECHDVARKDQEGNGTYKRVLNAIDLFNKYEIEYNVLCTLTNGIARHPQKVWKKMWQLGIKYVQFTPCLGELDDKEASAYALTPKRFATFYNQIFGLWYDAYKNGKFISIKLFDDIMNLLLLGIPTLCGINGTCQAQMVVEADGTVYPCDFYCLDEYRLGNVKVNRISEILNNEYVKNFINRPHMQPKVCSDCPYNAFCGGNCKRMQKEICCTGEDNYCGYRDLLDGCLGDFYKIAKQIINEKTGRNKNGR